MFFAAAAARGPPYAGRPGAGCDAATGKAESRKGSGAVLQLVLGPSGTGKSSWLFERVRERAVRGEKSLVLVP